MPAEGADVTPRGYTAQQEAVWELLGEGPATVAEAVDAIGLSRSRAGDILADLHRQGLATREGRPAVYARAEGADFTTRNGERLSAFTIPTTTTKDPDD